MVFYFKSEVVIPPYTIFMGIDKFENEDLIKFGWPEDVWFHVDKVSSAHVYLRLPKGHTIDDIPSAVLDDCAHLVKANSIQGNKMNNIGIVYTLWENLKKTGDMEVGQIGFHKRKEVRTMVVEKKINEVVNRLNRTKEERFPDLRLEREQRDQEERDDKRKELQAKTQQEKEDERHRKEEAQTRSYTNLMKTENMKSNKDGESDSDDFM